MAVDNEQIEREISRIRQHRSQMTQEDLDNFHKRQAESVEKEFEEFKEAYLKGLCYECGNSLNSLTLGKPCFHWLDRR